jgi:hypothetical protein
LAVSAAPRRRQTAGRECGYGSELMVRDLVLAFVVDSGALEASKKISCLQARSSGCFCTENLLVAHRPVMQRVADNGQLFAARLKRRSLQCQLLYAHSDPSQFGPT